MHVQYGTGLMGSSYTEETVAALAKLQYDHQVKWFSIPMYKPYYRPKNHWISHIIEGILRMTGPPRLAWCMKHEASYSEFRTWSKGINFKNAAKSLSDAWCNTRVFQRSLPSKILYSHSVKDLYCEIWLPTDTNYQLMTQLVPNSVASLPETIHVTWSSLAAHQGHPYTAGAQPIATMHAPFAACHDLHG